MADLFSAEPEPNAGSGSASALDPLAVRMRPRTMDEIAGQKHLTYPGSPLQQLATFQVPEARTILIAPFDKGCINEVEKAVRDSDLGVNPSSDGNVVRCVLPQLTEERRKEYTKMAKAKAEEGRIAIRAIRRSTNDLLKKQEKEKEISEDDLARLEKELDQVTKRHVEQIDSLLKVKEQELLEI